MMSRLPVKIKRKGILLFEVIALSEKQFFGALFHKHKSLVS